MQSSSNLMVTVAGAPVSPPNVAPVCIYGQLLSQALGTVGAAGNATFTLAVAGALTSGVVIVSPQATLPTALTCYGYVSAAGTVTIVVVNGSAAGIAGGTQSFNVVVLQ